MSPRREPLPILLLCTLVLSFIVTVQAQLKRPSCAKTGGLSRIVGYYETWSSYSWQRRCNMFTPEQIPLGVYTHLNVAYATIDPNTFEVFPATREDVGVYRRVAQLKKYDPDLELFISLGGWTFNSEKSTATTLSNLAAEEGNQQVFIKSLVSFMSTYGFDGVDIDWSYPAVKGRGGRPEDFDNLPRFVRRLKEALRSTGGREGLSITLPASQRHLQHFDIEKLVDYVDWFNVKTYDLHGTWDKGEKWTEASLNAHTNLTEVQSTMDHLWRNYIRPDKVVLGLAFYGRGFTATSSTCMEPGCSFESGSLFGNCSEEIGVLYNSEIDALLVEKNVKPQLYEDAAVKVVTWDDQWVAYDDVDTFRIKVDFAKGQCMGGVMVSAVGYDNENATYSIALDKIVDRKLKSLHRVDSEET
ncbi:glycoside hydrolase, partial [Aureobasidium melanogenum]